MKFDVRKVLDSTRARLLSAWRWIVDKLRVVPAQLKKLGNLPTWLGKLRVVPSAIVSGDDERTTARWKLLHCVATGNGRRRRVV